MRPALLALLLAIPARRPATSAPSSPATGIIARAPGRHRRPCRTPCQRAPVLDPAQQLSRAPPRAAPGGSRRIDSRGQRPARPGALHRAHGIQRHRPFRQERHGEVPRVDRREVRRRPQRQHVVRRNAVHPAGAERQAGTGRARVRHPAGLGDGRQVRPRRGGRRARCRPGRMAQRPRRFVADHQPGNPGPLQGFALRRAIADRRHRRSSLTPPRHR